MGVRVRIDDLGASPSGAYQAEKRLASLIRVEMGKVRLIFEQLPALLPIEMERDEGAALVEQLRGWGLSAAVVDVPSGSLVQCEQHPLFISAGRCASCRAEVCLFCQRGGGGMCPSCVDKSRRKRRNFRIRVTVLLTILAVVSIFAWKETRRRSIDWSRTQHVAVILLTEDGVSLDPDVVDEFRSRASDIEAVLAKESRLYRTAEAAPVSLQVFGPVVQQGLPPTPPTDNYIDLLGFNLKLGRFARRQDEVAGVLDDEFDVRLYVRATPSDGRVEAAEGIGQELGEIGVVTAQFSGEGIDFAWFVVLHEFFHTRGAKDKYDEMGHAKDPEGLADPDQEPLYPQEGTEVMARGRPLEPGREDIPGPVETWAVGEWTAREIGWLGPAGR